MDFKKILEDQLSSNIFFVIVLFIINHHIGTKDQ